MFRNNRKSEEEILGASLNLSVFKPFLIKNQSIIRKTMLSSKEKSDLLLHDWKFYKSIFSIKDLDFGHQISIAFRYSNIAPSIDWQRVAARDRNIVARYRPKWFVDYSIPTNGLSGTAWGHLVRFSDSYLHQALCDIKSPTELRRLLDQHPDKLCDISVDVMEASVLNPKHWLLLLNRDSLKESTYTKEQKNWIDQSLLSDILSATSTRTTHVDSARAKMNEA